MGRDALHLSLAAGVVDQQHQRQTDHEDVAGRQHAGEQRDQHQQEQPAVDPESARPLQGARFFGGFVKAVVAFDQYAGIRTASP